MEASAVAGTHRQSRSQTGTGRITRWLSLSNIFHEEKGTRRAVTQRRSLRRKGALARKSGEKKASAHQLTIWERNDWPSTLTVDMLTPLMSSMVGARSMFKTGAWSQETRRNQTRASCSNDLALTSTIWFGAIPGPRTMSGTLMSNSYSCLLSMGNENWPEQGGDRDTGVRGTRRRLLWGGGAERTCVVAVVWGEKNVSAVQLVDAVQFLHQPFHHVVHGDQRLPPAGRDSFLEATYHNYTLIQSRKFDLAETKTPLSIWLQAQMEEDAFSPFPEGIIQIFKRTRRHGICRLTQQPVFVLKCKEKQESS